MRINKLTFGLENCDSISFDGKYIGNFYLGKIKTEIKRIAINAIEKMDLCKEFYVEIHGDGNQPYCPFGIGSESELPFTRLTSFDDITSIEIEYEEDGKVETFNYIVVWSGDNECNNNNQDAIIGSNGNLYIKIGRKDFSDYFGQGFSSSKWCWMNDQELEVY